MRIYVIVPLVGYKLYVKLTKKLKGRCRHISRVLQVVAVMNQGGAENMIMNYYRAADKSKIQFVF